MVLIYDQRVRRWRDKRTGRFVSQRKGNDYLLRTRTIHFISKNGKLYRNHEIADRMRVRILEKKITEKEKTYHYKTVFTKVLDMSIYFQYMNGMIVPADPRVLIWIKSIMNVYKKQTIRGYLYAEIQVSINKHRSKYDRKTKRMVLYDESFQSDITFSSYQIQFPSEVPFMVRDFVEKSFEALQGAPGSDVKYLAHIVQFVLKSW